MTRTAGPPLPPPGAATRRVAALAIACAVCVAVWLAFVGNRAPGTAAALESFPLDDAWIHLVYARSLAQEGGFNYNVGAPETGMTSPLWVVLLAPLHALFGGSTRHLVLAVKLLSLLLGTAGVVALYGLARAFGETVAVATLAALLAALDPSLAFARASGMEVPLFSLLLVLALTLARKGRPAATSIAAGLAAVARPEALVIFPILLAILIARRRDFPHPARRIAAACLIAAAPALLYALFCLSVTGRPLPNTFYAKFTAQSPLSLGLLSFGWRHYIRDNLPYFTLQSGSLLALAGALRAARRGGWLGLAPAAGGVMLFVSALASRRFAPGHFFYWERWIIPAVPFLLLLIASGAGAAGEAAGALARRWSGGGGGARVGMAALVAAALLPVLPAPAALRERAKTFAWNCQNIDEMNVALGRWIDENLPPDAVIAVNDAGALRYFGNRETIDLIGLNSHRILHRDPTRGIRPLLELGVEYFVIFPSWFRDMVWSTPLSPIHSVKSPHYTICEGEQDLMVVYRLDGP